MSHIHAFLRKSATKFDSISCHKTWLALFVEVCNFDNYNLLGIDNITYRFTGVLYNLTGENFVKKRLKHLVTTIVFRNFVECVFKDEFFRPFGILTARYEGGANFGRGPPCILQLLDDFRKNVVVEKFLGSFVEILFRDSDFAFLLFVKRHDGTGGCLEV